jgi:hypothetical protein
VRLLVRVHEGQLRTEVGMLKGVRDHFVINNNGGHFEHFL